VIIWKKNAWNTGSKVVHRKKGGTHKKWSMPVILATQKAEIRRIEVWSQPRQTVPRDPIFKKPIRKKGWQSSSRWRLRVQTPVPQEKQQKSNYRATEIWDQILYQTINGGALKSHLTSPSISCFVCVTMLIRCNVVPDT
jgi:hypothetical protein